MPFFRVRMLEKNEWLDTWWGAPSEARPSVEGTHPTCRLTREQADRGLRDARGQYPEVKYHLKKYEGEPDNAHHSDPSLRV